MPSAVPVSSPQFRLQLIRKLGNLVPSHEVEFVEGCARASAFASKIEMVGTARTSFVFIATCGIHSMHLRLFSLSAVPVFRPQVFQERYRKDD